MVETLCYQYGLADVGDCEGMGVCEEGQVQSLVRELRSHMPCNMAKKKKKSERSVSMAKSFLFLEVYSLCLTLYHQFLALMHIRISWKSFKKCYCL